MGSARGRAARGSAEAWLAVRALCGQALTTVLTVVLASHLALVEFEAYAIAASVFLLMLVVAPLGADKVALRVLPPLLARGDWRRVSGFLRFALRRLAFGSLAAIALGLAWALGASQTEPAMRMAILVSLLALPFGAVAHLALEVLTAGGRAREATTIVRIVVPLCVLAIVASQVALGSPMSGATAIAAWAAAWIAASAMMLFLVRRDFRPALAARPEAEPAAWRAAARPLWLYRIAVGVQAQAGILALGWLGGTPASVGAYAAATAVVGPMLVLASSTNRAYSREIAILIERRDAAGLTELARRRRRWLLPALVLALALAFAFAAPLLALFRPEFVAHGIWPIRILSVAAVVSASFGLAPTVLKYRDRNAAIFRIVATSTGLQVVLLVALVPALGATGAALGYAASVALMYARLAGAARAEIERIRGEFRGPAGERD